MKDSAAMLPLEAARNFAHSDGNSCRVENRRIDPTVCAAAILLFRFARDALFQEIDDSDGVAAQSVFAVEAQCMGFLCGKSLQLRRRKMKSCLNPLVCSRTTGWPTISTRCLADTANLFEQPAAL